MGRLRLFLAMVCLGTACTSGSAQVRQPVQELSVPAGEVTLHVKAVGARDARATLITVHGGPGLSLDAMAPFEHLAGPGQRVVGYDQRGAGRSSSPADLDFSLAAQVADLEAVRIALGADVVQLAGESFGGAIAAAYAAEHPEHVRSLVLVDAMPLDREQVRAGQRRFQQHVVELQQRGLIPSPLPASAGGSCLPAFTAALPAYLADPRSEQVVSIGSCTASTSRATYEAFLADTSVEDVAGRLGGYAGSALLVMGAQDAFGREWLDRNAELLTGATVETSIVKAAGHLVMIEQPATVLATIRAFLGNQ